MLPVLLSPLSGRLELPQGQEGNVFASKPGNVLYRALPDNTLSPIGCESVRLSASAVSVAPLRLFNVDTAFGGTKHSYLRVERNHMNGEIRVSWGESDREEFTIATYDGTPPDPCFHARVPNGLTDRLLISRSGGAVYRVVSGGYLLAWGMGVYLGRSAVERGGVSALADIRAPERTVYAFNRS